jgi:hypothetical protein
VRRSGFRRRAATLVLFVAASVIFGAPSGFGGPRLGASATDVAVSPSLAVLDAAMAAAKLERSVERAASSRGFKQPGAAAFGFLPTAGTGFGPSWGGAFLVAPEGFSAGRTPGLAAARAPPRLGL